MEFLIEVEKLWNRTSLNTIFTMEKDGHDKIPLRVYLRPLKTFRFAHGNRDATNI
jgi:hypothetical protein